MVPFVVNESKNIVIQNLSIDYLRPIHSEAKVLAITPETVDVEISEEFPYVVRNGVLIFTGHKPAAKTKKGERVLEVVYPYSGLIAFDAKNKEPVRNAKDRYGLGGGIRAEEIGPRQVRLFLDRISAEPGNVLIFGPRRDNPGFIIDQSENILLEDVEIFNSGGMGVIAQFSKDVFLHKLRATPRQGESRAASLPADPTHFVNMKGKVELLDCVFESQKDDSFNIHGLYAKISRILGPNELEVQLVHSQQFGMDFIKPGTRLEITQSSTTNPLGYAEVAEVTRINEEYTLVKTGTPLPETLVEGDIVADADANTADVLIKNCIIAKNRANGIVLGSRGKIVIENNYFHTPGSAITLGGCVVYWYEQGGVRDLVIRGNTFDNCAFNLTFGKGIIWVGSGIDPDARAKSRYHQNIVIEDNLFRIFDSTPLLNLYAVDGLKFRNNRVEKTKDFPPREYANPQTFSIEGCANLDLEKPAGID